MESELSFDEALKQWKDLQRLGWGSYWNPSNEPKWAMSLTKTYANSWREVAYHRIATAFLAHIEDMERIR